MAQNQKFYKSRHTGKEIDDAIDSIGQIDKEMPTDIGLDENGKLILEHDGTEITGQKKQVVVPPWKVTNDDFILDDKDKHYSIVLGDKYEGTGSYTMIENNLVVNYDTNRVHYSSLINGELQVGYGPFQYNLKIDETAPDSLKLQTNNIVVTFPNKSGTIALTSDVDTKVSKSGDTITGNLTIQGNLSVSGTTTTVDTETLKVKDNVIVTNSDKNQLIDLSGLAINTDATNTFGIMYNPNTNTVDLGLGSIDADGKFTYNANEGLPLVIRDLNNTFTQDHLISWSTDKNKIVDSGIDKSVINNKLDKFTEPSETSRIYLVSKSGAQAMGNVDFTATAYYIPRYSAQATLTTQTPQKDIDCTNKQYVDNAIASVTIEVIDLSKGN